MKKTLTAVLVVFAALSMLATTGCAAWLGGPVKDANAAIADANNHLKTFAASDAQVQQLANQLSATDLTTAGATAALAITQQMQVELAKQKTELSQAKAAIASVKALDVREEFKKYADLEAKAIDTRITIVDEGTQLYAQMTQMYTAIRDKKTSNVQTQKITQTIDNIMNNIAALTEQAKTESEAAAAYFKAQKLGGQ